MSAEELKQAVNLIKAGKKIEARTILEPIIIAEPQNIQAWVWEIETRDNTAEKIKLMEACLLHNPESTLIKNALNAIKNREGQVGFASSSEISDSTSLDFDDGKKSGNENLNTDDTPAESIESESVGVFSVNPFTEMSEYMAESVESTSLKACPYCGELINESAEICSACGRDLTEKVILDVQTPEESTPQDQTLKDQIPEDAAPVEEAAEVSSSEVESNEKTHKKSWYRRPWVKILLFIFLMPIWCILELSDQEARKGLRVFAGILLVFSINLFSLVLFWFFTTNTSRANLYNWYQYLTGQSKNVTPGQFVQVEGNVQSPGSIPFSLVELQAKVYDEEGNLLGYSTQYLDSSSLIPGSPTHFKMDVTSLLSPFQSGMTNPQVLFYDDFSDPTTGWQENSGEKGETTYAEGKYRITVNSINFDLWSNPGKSYTDTKIEVDTIRQGGPESNRFGVQCRYKDVDNYYFAVISSDGYYGIGKVVDGEQSFIPENGMQVTDTIYAGTAVNHIRFDCVGTRLTLYVNGDYVQAVDDSDLTTGDIGLLAGTFDKKGTKILFDNLVVFQP